MTDPRSTADALIRGNRTRRRVRFWVAIGTLPLTIAALVLVAKLFSMFVFAHFAITDYVGGDGEGTVRNAGWQKPLNWFEPYKAPYNAGDGYALSEKLPEARAEFEDALSLARGLEVCAVRINLAFVIERQGDAATEAGDLKSAQAFYAEALTVNAETPQECKSDEAQDQSPDPNRDMSDTLEQQQKDLSEKQQQNQQQQDRQQNGEQDPQQPTEPDEEKQQDQPSQEQLDELQQKLEEGQQERDQRGDDGTGGGGTEKPW